jgi:hypothetical protein
MLTIMNGLPMLLKLNNIFDFLENDRAGLPTIFLYDWRETRPDASPKVLLSGIHIHLSATVIVGDTHK